MGDAGVSSWWGGGWAEADSSSARSSAAARRKTVGSPAAAATGRAGSRNAQDKEKRDTTHPSSGVSNKQQQRRRARAAAPRPRPCWMLCRDDRSLARRDSIDKRKNREKHVYEVKRTGGEPLTTTHHDDASGRRHDTHPRCRCHRTALLLLTRCAAPPIVMVRALLLLTPPGRCAAWRRPRRGNDAGLPGSRVRQPTSQLKAWDALTFAVTAQPRQSPGAPPRSHGG